MRNRDGILNASERQIVFSPWPRWPLSKPALRPSMSDLRVIPSIEQLRQRDAMRALETRYGRAALLDALRAETAGLRDRLASGDVAAVTVDEAIHEIESGAESRLRTAMRPSRVRVINATGVLV